MEQYAMLEARIAKLEQRIRLVLVGWISTLALAVVFGLGVRQITAQPTVFRVQRIEAEELRIVSPGGCTLISLTSFPPRLALYGINGRTLMRFDAIGEPELTMYDGRGRQRIKLGFGTLFMPPEQFEHAHLSFYDAQERQRVVLGFSYSQLPQFEIAGVQIYDSQKRSRMKFQLVSGSQRISGSPNLELLDPVGRPLFKAP
jgi:hypothetical protein